MAGAPFAGWAAEVIIDTKGEAGMDTTTAVRADAQTDPPAGNAGSDETRTLIRIDALTKSYGPASRAVRAIAGLTLEVYEREILCVVGPSGAGKTTLLKCLAGLVQPTSGAIFLDGVAVTGPPERLGLVFQDYSRSLMPWMTVLGNVILPLRGKGVSKEEMRSRGVEMLAAVGLAHVAGSYPWQLSGGMQQRVAIARALAYRPLVLLMDEPFASLDAQTRMDLEDLVLPLRSKFGVTVVFVTHDIDEAVYLGDRVAVMSASPSRIERVVTVGLPLPRDQLLTKSDPMFVELRHDIMSMIRHT